MNTRSVSLAVVLLLSACAGPRREPPPLATVSVPTAWRGAEATNDALTTGWESFADPELVRLVSTALVRNLDVAIAAANVTEARAQFRLARAHQGLSVDGVLEGLRDRDVNPGFGVAEEQGATQGLIRASFDLDLFGRLSSASKAARAGLLATQAAQDNVRLAVASATASGYITLRSLDARLDLLQQTLDARRRELAIARRLTQAGYSASLDLAQAEAEYAATLELIPATQLSISQQEDGLSVLTGDNPRAIARGVEFAALAVPSVPLSLPATMLSRRPDIAAAAQQLVAADRTLDAARAAFLPDIQLAASAGYASSTLVQASPIALWAAGGSILAPLFESGALRAQEDIATSRRDQAALGYRRVAILAFREVEDDLSALKRDGEQESALSQEADALSRALKLATNRYRAGYAGYLDQLDAQRNLLAAQLALVQAHTDRLNATVSLYQALGGDWVHRNE
jgi:multidrug efflux system outer membrane protein